MTGIGVNDFRRAGMHTVVATDAKTGKTILGHGAGGRSRVSLARYRAAPRRRPQRPSNAPAAPAKNARRATRNFSEEARAFNLVQSAFLAENSRSCSPLNGQMRTHQSMPKSKVAPSKTPRPRQIRITDIGFVALFTAKGLLKMHRGSIHSSTGYPVTAPTNVSIATYLPTGGHLLHQRILRNPVREAFSSKKPVGHT